MAHPLDIEARRLTRATGIYHVADYDDIANEMRIFTHGELGKGYNPTREEFEYTAKRQEAFESKHCA